MKYIPHIISFVLFIALCVTASYWVMFLIKPQVRKISVPPITHPVADVESVAGLFGGSLVLDTSYQVTGIIQANPMDQSVAIIAVDGKQTKAYAMDMEIIPGSTINTVSSGYILLKDNGITKRVELPKDAPAPITPVRFMSPAISGSGRAPVPGGSGHDTSNRALMDMQHRAATPNVPPNMAPNAAPNAHPGSNPNMPQGAHPNLPSNIQNERGGMPPGQLPEKGLPPQQTPPLPITH